MAVKGDKHHFLSVNKVKEEQVQFTERKYKRSITRSDKEDISASSEISSAKSSAAASLSPRESPILLRKEDTAVLVREGKRREKKEEEF